MSFLGRLFGRPSPQPSKISTPLTEDALPPEQRWVLGPPPDYAWWLNEMLVAISDSREPLGRALCDPDFINASIHDTKISEATKHQVLSSLEGFCSALTIDDRKVPAKQELWTGYSHHTFVQTLGELKGLCELFASYIRDGDSSRAWKLQFRLNDERHWQLMDLQALLSRFIINRQDPTRREQMPKSDMLLAHTELADLYEKPGYIDYMAERGYSPRWMTSKILDRRPESQPADPEQLAAQLKAMLVILLRGLGAFHKVIDPADDEALVRILPALTGRGKIGPNERDALKKAAGEFGWVEYLIESATPEPPPLWTGFSRQTYRQLAQEMGGLATEVSGGILLGDTGKVSSALKKLVLSPEYQDRLWDLQSLLTSYDLAKKPASERARSMQDEWTHRMVEHTDYLAKLDGDVPDRDSRPRQEWHVNMTKALAREGIDLFNRDQYQEASELLDLSLTCNPDDLLAAFYMAASLSRLGNFEKALPFYEQAEVVGKSIAQYWNERGLTLRARGLYSEALACLERAVELAPDKGCWWTNKALILLDLKEYDKAIKDCNRALAVKPRDTMALKCRADCLDYLNRTAEATESYDQALELDPMAPELWLDKAIALDRQGRKDEAMQHCEHSLGLSPDFERAKAVRTRWLESGEGSSAG